MNRQDILDLKIDSCDLDEPLTIRAYLKLLLIQLWEEGESFNGKRPFGNSGWEHELYVPLVKNGIVDGKVDEDGYVYDIDTRKADIIVKKLIEDM